VQTQPLRVLDYFKREIKLGDYVAMVTSSYKKGHITVGRVTNITKAGNVSIDTASIKKWSKRIVTNQKGGSSCVIISPSSVPDTFRMFFEGCDRSAIGELEEGFFGAK
jgi:hypothetical protein